jgi:hypothetical protein
VVTQVKSTFETVAGGTTLTTANTNFTAVTPGASNTITADATKVRYPGQTSSMKFTIASTNPSFAYWSTSAPAWTGGAPTSMTRFGRCYINPAAVTSTNHSMFGCMTATFGSLFSIRRTVTNAFAAYNASGAVIATAGVGPAANAWCRVEFGITVATSTTGSGEMRIFLDPDSEDPDDVKTFSGVNLGTVTPPFHFAGPISGTSVSGPVFNVSEMAYSDTDWLGPRTPRMIGWGWGVMPPRF